MRSPTTLKLTDVDLSPSKKPGAATVPGGSTPETPMPLFDLNPSLQAFDSPPLTPGIGSTDRTITRGTSPEAPAAAMDYRQEFGFRARRPGLESTRSETIPDQLDWMHERLMGPNAAAADNTIHTDTLVTRFDELQGLFSDLTQWAEALQHRVNNRRNPR